MDRAQDQPRTAEQLVQIDAPVVSLYVPCAKMM